MSENDDWGRCHIPAIGSPEYRQKYCDPHSQWRKNRDHPQQERPRQYQPQQQHQGHFSKQDTPLDPEWKVRLMEDSGAD